MAKTLLDQLLVREPRLLVPWRQPLGAVASTMRARLGLVGLWIPGKGDITGQRDAGKIANKTSGEGRLYALTNTLEERITLDTNAADFMPTAASHSILCAVQYGSALGTGDAVGVQIFPSTESTPEFLQSRASLFLGQSGNVHFDYGGATAGSTRVSASVTTADKTMAAYVGTVGSRGMEIWKGGVLIASNSAQPTRLQYSTPYAIGDLYGGTSSAMTYLIVAAWNRQLSRSLCIRASLNPFAIVDIA